MAEMGTDIEKASALLQEGELVAIPTETVYGLAADATNPHAVARIFEAKNRPNFDPLIVHLYDSESLEKYCTGIPDVFYELYNKFSPGPLTYILPKTDNIRDLVTSGQPTVGIRFPRHPLTRELLKRSNLALAAPSANPFGYISPTKAAHVEEQLGEKIAYILDGGNCEVGVESTIIDLSGKRPKVLRLGGIEVEEIEAAIGPVMVNRSSSSNPKAPGMLTSHYAPGKELVTGNIEDLLEKYPPKNVGILSFAKTYPEVPKKRQRILSETGNLREAATGLFAALRELDKLKIDTILAENFPNKGLGRAINDRLERAAAKRDHTSK